MEKLHIALATWGTITSILVVWFRASNQLGRGRSQHWKEYLAGLTETDDGLCLFVWFLSLIFLPGVLTVATWDWVVYPLLKWPFGMLFKRRLEKKLKQAIKRLPPFEQECHKKIQQIREQVQELQNTLNAQYKDNDPDTPSAETQRLVKEKIEQLEKAENELWAQVSHLPMGDLPVHQCLEISEKVLTEARELLQAADDPDIRVLRGAAPTKEEEEAAREELRQ